MNTKKDERDKEFDEYLNKLVKDTRDKIPGAAQEIVDIERGCDEEEGDDEVDTEKDVVDDQDIDIEDEFEEDSDHEASVMTEITHEQTRVPHGSTGNDTKK